MLYKNKRYLIIAAVGIYVYLHFNRIPNSSGIIGKKYLNPYSEKIEFEPHVDKKSNFTDFEQNNSSKRLAIKIGKNESEITLGTCSARAARMGNHQKVIAYSVYGDSNSSYWRGIPLNIVLTLKLYPGWLVRVYTDNPGPIRYLEDEYPEVFFVCDIRSLPRPITNLVDYPSMMWRFFPLGDSQIDILNIRDTDSKITTREADADQEWLKKSNKTLHVMRDHPKHLIQIVGGCWGAKITPKNRELWLKLRNKLMDQSFKSTKVYGLDQILLRKIVWPVMINDVIAHDSYRCRRFPPGSTPWPTQRVGGEFVQQAFYKRVKHIFKRCPSQCRPKDHQDWIYC